MIIFIQDEIIEMTEASVKSEDVVEIIYKMLEKKNLELSHLIIDEKAVYNDYTAYINMHMTEIEKVEVIVATTKKLVNDIITSTEEYLVNAIPSVKSLAEEFYQQPEAKTWIKFMALFEGLQWILETLVKTDGINGLDKMVTQYEIWNEYVQTVSELSRVIPELESAMLSQDNVLIGDLLLYEIIPVFEKMIEALRFLEIGRGDGNVS